MKRYVLWAWYSPLVWWSLTLLWCGLVFHFSTDPRLTGESTLATISAAAPVIGIKSRGLFDLINFGVRKSAHLAGFASLSISVWRALTTWPGPRGATQLAWVLTLLYAVSDEFHQTLVPGRTGTVLDVLLDGAGAGIALLIFPRLVARWKLS